MLYETRKNIWLILLALVFAALAATLATRWMKNRTAEIDAAQQKFSSLVIAARDVRSVVDSRPGTSKSCAPPPRRSRPMLTRTPPRW